MSELFLNCDTLGELYYYHIYLFYDEPLIFSCANKANQYYFFVAVPTDDDEENAWLVAPVSSGKLLKAENNAVEIRSMLLSPETVLLHIQETLMGVSIHNVNPELLTEEYLPKEGMFLDYEAGIELLPSDEVVTHKASQEMRDIIEISLEEDNGHTHELPCLTIANALNDVQQLVYSLAYKDGGLRGAIPQRIKDACRLDVTGMFAASVGIRLKSNEICDIYKETPLTQTLQDFNYLFEVSGNKEKLKEFLAKHNPRVACKFKRLLSNLLHDRVGIKLNNASPNNCVYTQHFSTTELSARLAFIQSEINQIREKEEVYGSMIGINVEKKTFAFTSVEKEHISGKLDASIIDQVFVVPQVGRAQIELTIDQDSMSKEEKINFTLLNFEPLAEE